MNTASKILPALMLALLSGCESDTPAAPLYAGTTVEILGVPSQGILITDAELQLSAVVRRADSAEVTGIQPVWTSSDESLATVSASGLVVALRPGEVELRVNAGGATDRRSISVRTRIPLLRDGNSTLTSSLLGDAMEITVNAGAVSGSTELHVRAVTDAPASARLVKGTAVEIGPPGVSFGAAVTLALRYPSSIGAAEQALLRVHQLVDGVWIRVPGGSADLSAGRALASIPRTGIYAVLRPAGAASLRKDAGDGQRALAGSFVSVAPRVMVRDAQDNPVEGAQVRFFVTAGGGAIVGEAGATTNAEGLATLPGQWRLGSTSTENTLSAELVGSSIAPVVFTATLETISLVITRELAGAVSGRLASTQPRLEFRTGSGALLNVSDAVTVELLSGSGALLGTRSANASGGVVTFTNLQINGSGAHQVRFTSGERQANGSVFTVTQELATLQVLVQPAGAEDDESFGTQPVIQLLDDAGLPYLPPINVTASLASGLGDLRGGRSVTSSAGRASFTNLRINGEGMHRLRFETTSPVRTVLSELFNVIDD